MTKIVAAALAAFLLAASPAFADTTVSFAPLANTLLEYLVPALGVLITALIGWAVALIKKRTGIEIEARHREALHSAAMTGVRLAVERLGVQPGGLSIDVKSEVLAEAASWVQESVPGALKHFGVTPEQMAAIIASKLPAATANTAI